MYYTPSVKKFIIQNLKSDYIGTKTSLSPVKSEYGSSKIMTLLGLYNWYIFDWEENGVNLRIVYKPNLDMLLVITDDSISSVNSTSAYVKASQYLLLPEKLEFECDSNVCISTWENKHLVVGKIEGQQITIALGEEIK